MFSWFRRKPKILHISFSHEELLYLRGLVMSLASDLKDAVLVVDGAADKVVAAINALKAANVNVLSEQEVSDLKASLAGVKTKLDNAVV